MKEEGHGRNDHLVAPHGARGTRVGQGFRLAGVAAETARATHFPPCSERGLRRPDRPGVEPATGGGGARHPLPRADALPVSVSGAAGGWTHHRGTVGAGGGVGRVQCPHPWPDRTGAFLPSRAIVPRRTQGSMVGPACTPGPFRVRGSVPLGCGGVLQKRVEDLSQCVGEHDRLTVFGSRGPALSGYGSVERLIGIGGGGVMGLPSGVEGGGHGGVGRAGEARPPPFPRWFGRRDRCDGFVAFLMRDNTPE